MLAIPATSNAAGLKGVQKRVNRATERLRVLKGEFKQERALDEQREAGTNARFDEVEGKVHGIEAGTNARFDEVEGKVQGILDDLAPTILNGIAALNDALHGPNVAGQLDAAGTAAPGPSNSATPSTLPTGTLYRQTVLSTGGSFGPGAPIGARTWVKMPDTPAIGYSNKYACTSAGLTDTAAAGGYTVTCTTP
jgi:hypothetical protein